MNKALYPNRVGHLRRCWDPAASQEDLAELLGVERNTVSRIELGYIALTYDRIVSLARIFRCHPGELFEPLPELPARLAEVWHVAERLDDDALAAWLDMGRRLQRD